MLLIISGVLSSMEYLANRPENCTRTVLLNGLVEAGWPLIAASVILLLIQMNRQLEKLRLESSAELNVSLPVKGKKKKSRSGKEEADGPGSQVTHRQQAAAPQFGSLATHPGGHVAPIPAHSPLQPITRPQAVPQVAPPLPAAVRQPMYPNSPIPGGGRVPQHAEAASPPLPQPPRPEARPAASGGKRAPGKNEVGKLTYFKVD